MMNGVRPSVGVILLQAEWFDTVVALPQFQASLKQDTASITSAFPTELDLIQVWVVNSPGSLQDCTRDIRNLQLDLVVLAFQVWAEDWYLQPIVDAIGEQPLAVWCYLPSAKPPFPASFIDVLRFSGPVGTLEGLGTLRNMGTPFSFLIGAPDSFQFKSQLVAVARAGSAFQTLRHTRVGLLPSHNEQMQSTFVDESRLRLDLGPQVVPISVRELEQASSNVSQTDLDNFINTLQQLPIKGVSQETIKRASRASLGLINLAVEKQLDALTMNEISPELHSALGLRPCLMPLDGMGNSTILFSLEGDLGAAVAMIALSRMSVSSLFFVEFWFWDEGKNFLVGGHAGMQDPRNALPSSLFINRDLEYSQSDETEGACFEFVCHPGAITLLQVRCTPTGWQAISCLGEVIDHPVWIEGYPHAIIKPAVNVLDFFRQAAEVGTTQHWIMCYGNAMESVRVWCQMEKIALKEIS